MRLIAGAAVAAIALPAAVVGGESPVVYVFETVALAGDAAPGTTETFTSFSDPVLNGAGEVAFLGYFGAAMDQGIFTDKRRDARRGRARGRSRTGHDRNVHALRRPRARAGRGG
jgi:hypothetical protein